mmetsp:Transcript_26496/g.64573  ORF Transcript_26496/g.64573 Transcript_26496/m.64573 type:complete len:101 (-) Transcript_26496:1252-1554(-)
MDASLGLSGKSSGQSQQDKAGEDTPSNLYCATDIAAPPPLALSKLTKVAAPLTEEQLRSIPKKHEVLCKCGCIPPIPTMFQMAELRKQAREKAKREQETK